MLLKPFFNWIYEKCFKYFIARDVTNLVMEWIEMGNKNNKDLRKIDLIQQQNLVHMSEVVTRLIEAEKQILKLSKSSDCPWEIFKSEKTI